MSASLWLCLIWCKSTHSGLLAKWVKCKEFFNLYLFLRELTCRSDPSTDLHAWWLKRRRHTQECAFWGFCWYCSPFWGWNPPQPLPPFCQTGKIMQLSYYRIYCIYFSIIVHNDRDRQVVIVGGLNTCPANPRWQTAAILNTTVKSPCLCNLLPDFDDVLHNDAHWTLIVDPSLQFRIFENPRRWRRPPSLQSQKSQYLCNSLIGLYEIW